MSAFTDIDLEKLPAPQVVESLSFETILSEMIEQLTELMPEFSANVESDPVYKILEISAYREVVMRARVNDAAKAVLLAYATENDLDNIAVFFGVEREITEGDPAATPPVADEVETDDRLRRRTQLALEGFTTAGSTGSYIFHTLNSHPLIKDVDIRSPEPGEVVVVVLTSEGDGTPTDEIEEAVMNALTAEDVRPLTDHVIFGFTAIIPYSIDAELFLFDEPDSGVVIEAATNAITEYVQENHRLGRDISLSGIYAALHQPGVSRVVLNKPTQDQVIDFGHAAFCDEINVTYGGRSE